MVFMYKFIAKQYRKPKGIIGRIISWRMKNHNLIAYKRLVPLMEIKPEDVVFEIGYGPGLGMYNILTEYGCKMEGVDFSELMYKEATKRNEKFIEQNRLKLNFGNFLNFQMPEKRYEIIFCINVIYFWDDLLLPFNIIKHGLKNNGVFYMYMTASDILSHNNFSKPDIFNKHSIEFVVEKLREAGFSNIEFHKKRGYLIQCS